MEQVVFAQISDLHFGNRPFVDHSVGGLGQKGHDWLLCKALPDGLKDLLRRYGAETVYLLMTGDLTRLGNVQVDSESEKNEFQVGLEYLSSQWDLEPGRPAKRIRLPKQIDSRIFTIPGNHDHWDGDTNKMHSFNSNVYTNGYFKETPWREIIESPTGIFRVELFGIDSTRGIRVDAQGLPQQTSNRRGRGRVAPADFEELEKLLTESRETEAVDLKAGVISGPVVRVLLCHHSFLLSSLLKSWVPTILKLDHKSQYEIKNLARNYCIPVVLTGHNHAFLADRIDGFVKFKFYEYRSSKTLQGPAKDFVQGFWGHRICMDEQNYKIWWEALPYFFQGRYFQAMDLAPYTNPGQSREPFAFTLN